MDAMRIRVCVYIYHGQKCEQRKKLLFEHRWSIKALAPADILATSDQRLSLSVLVASDEPTRHQTCGSLETGQLSEV